MTNIAGSTPAQEEHEVERKYDVDEDAAVPDLSRLAGVSTGTGGVGGVDGVGSAGAHPSPPTELHQVATYYDTPDFRLLQARVTLRRRIGGVDDGWHLKLPAGGDARREIRLPPGAEGASVPEELLERVRVHVRDGSVRPVAELRTHRTLRHLHAEDGTDLAELCDDRVEAETDGAAVHTWREWELEIVDGPRELLDEAEPLLLAAGARPASVGSKVARVLANSAPPAPAWRSATEPGPEATTADLLAFYLAHQLLRLEEQDRMLRAGDQEGVHKLRIAARRLRSALATYAPVLTGDRPARLGEELRWLGSVLAEARDAQVLRDRLAGLVRAQPDELVLGPVLRRIDDELGAAFRTGRSTALKTLSGARYFTLLGDLEAFVAAPPLTARAARPAHQELPWLLRRDLRRVRRRDQRVAEATGREEEDEALHAVRKAAKRLRYAAESADPVLGDDAARLGECAKAMQELLGEHQDTVVARRTVRVIGIQAHRAGESGFTFGRLHALEERRADELVAQYPACLAALHSL